jgi:hypothetical protein
MFWTEEDISPVVQVANSVFGPVGNMSMEPNTNYNVAIETARFGKIWYGDVEGGVETLIRKKQELERLIGEDVAITTI